jgi:uncharacterized protein
MNTPFQTSSPFDDEQLDRLEVLLDAPGFEESMRLDEIQGYLCAALSGPMPIDEEDRLIDILGSEEAVNSAAGQEIAELIRQFAEALAAELAADKPPALLLYPKDEGDDEDANDYLPWCQAYLLGIDQSPEDWYESIEETGGEEGEAQAEFLDERIFQMMVLTGDAEAAAKEHGEEWPEGDELATIERECEEELPHVVTEIYRFWLARRGVGTIRKETPDIGRNDPCPCGSGKKFKQCCGRE